MDALKYFNSFMLHFIFVTYFAMLGSGKLNECKQCKVLSDSFNTWLQKTARGKHDGGDTAWEEAKLKSYSRSEMRLVEIQEGLCSEVKKYKDQCYSLTEEVEHLIEQWWVHEDPNSQDLFTWLCVNTLEYCCPKNHYGALCTPCPLDENNRICGERGTCDGEGTRKGNGTCICNTGFSGEFCENCAQNYYSLLEDCKPCHKACNGCNGEGAASCQQCKIGWKLESGVCMDINECLNTNSCKFKEFCVNQEGSYSCKACSDTCKTCSGRGQENCTSCEPNHILWNGMCLDEILKQQFLLSALKRAVLYVFLSLILIFICQRIKLLTSIIILLVAILIYIFEKNSNFNMFSIYYILK